MPKRKNVFYAYPGHPTSVAECIEGAIGALKSAPRIKQANLRFTPWTEMQIGGKTLISTITRNISRADIFACDLTHPNFNVTFELGYAIGKFKRVWLSLNEAVEASAQTYKRVYSGMLGGLGYAKYTNHLNLSEAFDAASPWTDLNAAPLGAAFRLQPKQQERPTLLYIKPSLDTEAVITAAETLRDSDFRDNIIVDDPKENPSPELDWYASKILISDAVLIQLLANNEVGAYNHNIRCSFAAGLAYGFNKNILMVAAAPFDSPSDYEKLLKIHETSLQCRSLLGDWTSDIHSSIPSRRNRRPTERTTATTKLDVRSLSVGDPVAENEHSRIDDYFVETSSFFRALESPTSILVGRRGTGKTASLYAMSRRLSYDKRNHVCVIKPVGYEIDGLVRVLNENMDRSERGYLIESIWKFLIFSELALSVYRELSAKPPHVSSTPEEQAFIDFIDSRKHSILVPFSERLDHVVTGLVGIGTLDNAKNQRVRISELLHDGELRYLRQHLGMVLGGYNKVAILVDNLDDPWGQGHDIDRLSELLLGLLKVIDDVSDEFHHEDHWRKPVNCSVTVFLRSDIFSLIQLRAAEQDKLPVERMYLDRDLLLKLLEQRFQYASEVNFEAADVWEQLMPSDVVGVPTTEFVTRTVLPRPRDIIYLVRSAIASAVNRGDASLQANDFLTARERYSEFVFKSVLAEDDPSKGKLEDVLFEFAGAPKLLTLSDVKSRLARGKVNPSEEEFYIDLLCDINFLGIEVRHGGYRYSRDEGERRMLRQVAQQISANTATGEECYEINAAFHQVLQID